MGTQRRSVTPEFKQDAVDLVRRSGKSGCQVARELDIAQPTLNRWTRQAAATPLGSSGFLATEELKVLRREVEQLRMERDILKKTVVGSGLLRQGVVMRYRFIQAEKAHYPPWGSCVRCSP
jgi:transposase